MKLKFYLYILYCVLRDHLGSVTQVVDYDGTVLEKLSYDPWGRLRNPSTGAYYAHGKAPEPYLGRGYCGHEHLTEIELINMNACIYDPVIGRFVSADPHIQNPEISQNFNRYAYALNNPLSYVDRDGEFLGTIFTAVFEFFKNFFTRGVNFHHYNWKKTRNAFKIDLSTFQGGFWRVLNNLTWGLKSTVVGSIISHGYNIAGKIDKVTQMDGVAALAGATSGGKAFTVGHYSLGPDNYEATWKDHLFVHEYGHYIQSQIFGPMYFPVVAIPSLLSASFTSDWSGMDHSQRWFEVHASKLASHHFEKKYGSGAAGYKPNDKNYFDRYKFENGGRPAYRNSRNQNNEDSYQAGHQSHGGGKFVVWDLIL